MGVITTLRRVGLLAGAAALVLTLPVATAEAADPAAHASTPAERQARGESAARAFMMGRYDEALATYLDLYIQSDGRPEYLRNIGRCQQKLHQYAAAIDSFKEYLRRAKKLSADEKKEVQGFINEMQTAQAQTAQANDSAAGKSSGPAAAPAAPAPLQPAPKPAASAPLPAATPAPSYATAPSAGYPPSPSHPPSPSPSPSSPPYGPSPGTTLPYSGASPGAPTSQPPATAWPTGSSGGTNVAMGGVPSAPNPNSSPSPPDVITRSAPEATKTSSSPLKPIGIVSVVVAGAAAIGGTIALVRAKSIYNDASDAGCRTGQAGTLFCNGKADSVQSANTISKILYIGAGVLGIAGVIMIAVAPAPTPEGRVGLAVTGRF